MLEQPRMDTAPTNATLLVKHRKRVAILLVAFALAAVSAWFSRSYLHRALHPLRPGFNPAKNVLSKATTRVLEQPDSFTLLAIDPDRMRTASDSTNPPTELFHNFGVLGKAAILSSTDRAELVSALRKGIADSDGSVAACFNPRHGIIARRGKETTELLICFECQSLRVYGTETNGVRTTGSPGKTFDAALGKAGLPRAK